MMVWWRFKRNTPCEWRFGWMTHLDGSSGLIRMGLWHGDTILGPVVSRDEIEMKDYR